MTATLVLIHGFHRTGKALASLGEYFRQQGYRVLIPELPTTKERLGKCVEVLEQFFDEHGVGKDNSPVHLVGHSYGGLIARGLLAKRTIPGLLSLTCLGSSHQGTRLANVLRFFRVHWWEPALLEFCTPGPQIPPPRQGWPPLVHLIAGSQNTLLWGRALLPQASDGRLTIRSALAQGTHGTQVPFPQNTLRTILPLDHHQLMEVPLVAEALVQAWSTP